MLQYLEENISPNSPYPYINSFNLYHITSILCQDSLLLLYPNFGLDINACTSDNHWNALHCILNNPNKTKNNNQARTIALLLNFGVDPNQLDILNRNTLTVLCSKPFNSNILSLLLLWGVDSQIDEETGKHPIHGFLYENNLEAVLVK